MKKKVQLVLGSGGARGVTQIGVIEMLLQEGFEIVEVAGCSMGAVVGGMFCSGHLNEYRDWLLKLNKADVYRMFDLTFSRQGLVKGEKIFGTLQQMMGEHSIENLPIPFTAVATDMLTRTEVHFKSGNLYKALRASTGIPGVFTPVLEDKYFFVDGGVLNPVPVNLMKRREDAMIVVVNLDGAVQAEAPSDNPSNTDERKDIITRMRNYFLSLEKPTTKNGITSPVDFSIFELLNASYDSTQDKLVEMTLAAYPPDVLINIPRNVCSVFDFHRTAELIDFGKKAYAKAMEKFDVEKAVNT